MTFNYTEYLEALAVIHIGNAKTSRGGGRTIKNAGEIESRQAKSREGYFARGDFLLPVHCRIFSLFLASCAIIEYLVLRHLGLSSNGGEVIRARAPKA